MLYDFKFVFLPDPVWTPIAFGTLAGVCPGFVDAGVLTTSVLNQTLVDIHTSGHLANLKSHESLNTDQISFVLWSGKKRLPPM